MGTVKNITFYDIEDVKGSGAETFENCHFRGVDFSGYSCTAFYGCKFVACKVAGLTVNTIASAISGAGDGLVLERDSALLSCEGIEEIKFLRPKQVNVFVSSDTNAELQENEFHGDVDWIIQCYSLNSEDYLKIVA